MKSLKKIVFYVLTAIFAISAVACSGGNSLKGTVKADGSSTVGPITQAVAEDFRNTNKDVEVTVGVSGTGGGFKKFYAGETDINNASRKIKQEEIDKAKENKIDMTEFEVAYDGIAIVVNKNNTWLDSITKEELKKIWDKDSTVKTWNEVNPAWPNKPIKLYGPGIDSGTFDFFTEHINGKEKRIRPDFTASEDDNVLVQGVSGDEGAMGYFGVAYYEENKDKIKLVKLEEIEPTLETVQSLKYPLARPLYIYVNNKSLEKPEVKAFIRFYLENAKELVTSVGYFPLQDEKYQNGLNKIK